jgi:hypothetical protein
MRTLILALAIAAGFVTTVAAGDNTMCIRQCNADGTYCTIYCI